MYHTGQVPSGVTFTEMEQGPISHADEEGNLVKKGVKGSRTEKEAPQVIYHDGYHPQAPEKIKEKAVDYYHEGKGSKQKTEYFIDGDGLGYEEMTHPPEEYYHQLPEKIPKAVTRPPDGYDDADNYEETPKGVSYYKKGSTKKYQTDKLPSIAPKESPGAKAQKYYSDEIGMMPDKEQGGGEKSADHTSNVNPDTSVSPPGGDAAPETNNGDIAIAPEETASIAGGKDASDLTNRDEGQVVRTLSVAAFHYTTGSTDAASVGDVEELAAATAEVLTALYQAAFPGLYELKLIEYGALTDRLVKYKVELYFQDRPDVPTDAQVKAAAVAGFADQALYNRAYLQRLSQMESSLYSTTSSVVFIADNEGILEAQTASSVSDSSEDDDIVRVLAPIVSGLAIFAFLGSMIYARRNLQPLADEEHAALKSKSHSQTQEDATDDGGTMMSDFRTVAFSEDGIEDTVHRTSQQEASDLGSTLDLELEQVMARMNDFEEVSLQDDDDASQSSASATSNLTDYGKHPQSCEAANGNVASSDDETSLGDQEVAHTTMIAAAKAETKKAGNPFTWKWSSSPEASIEAEKGTTTPIEQRKTPPTTTPRLEDDNDALALSDQHSMQSSSPYKGVEAQEDGMIEVVYKDSLEAARSDLGQVKPLKKQMDVPQQQNQITSSKTVKQDLANEAAGVFRKAEIKAKPSIEEKQINRFDKREENSKPEWMNKKLRATGTTNKFETPSRTSSRDSNVVLRHQSSRSTMTTPCSIGTETDSKDCSFRSSTALKDIPKPAWVAMKLRPTSPKSDNMRDQTVSTSAENTGVQDNKHDSSQHSSHTVEEGLQPMTDTAEHYDYDMAEDDLESIEYSVNDDGVPMEGVEVKFEPAWMRKRQVSPVPLQNQEPQVTEDDTPPEPDTSALPEWMRKFHTMGLRKEDD